MKRPTQREGSAKPRLAPPNRRAAGKAARRHLRSACERCRTTEDLQAHHFDGNWRNNAKGNIVTLCAKCHSDFHSGRWKNARVGGRKLIHAKWVGLNMTATPLPRKSKEVLAYAAAWSARQLLESLVEGGPEGEYRAGSWKYDWSSMKRRFFISGDDNNRLERSYIAACDRLGVVPVGGVGITAQLKRGLPVCESPAEWYAKHHDRLEELRQLAKDEVERCRQAVPGQPYRRPIDPDAAPKPTHFRPGTKNFRLRRKWAVLYRKAAKRYREKARRLRVAGKDPSEFAKRADECLRDAAECDRLTSPAPS